LETEETRSRSTPDFYL